MKSGRKLSVGEVRRRFPCFHSMLNIFFLLLFSADLSEEQRREENRLRDMPDSFDDEGGGGYEEDILHGRTAAAISHAGEALAPENAVRADEELLEGLCANHRLVFYFNPEGLWLMFSFTRQIFGRYTDTRMRRDRTQKQVNAFAAQMKPMTDAYLEWSASTRGGLDDYESPLDAIVQETRDVLVVDMFCTPTGFSQL
jgi:hypothetical protein